MSKIRVGILRGGPSDEYDISLKTGATVLSYLPEKYLPIDIFISKQGEWHVGGITKSPDTILKTVDVVFNALHGTYGEDGGVQMLLEKEAVSYTGSSAAASAVAMKKHISKAFYRRSDLKTPHSIVVSSKTDSFSLARDIFKNFPQPCVIKPSSQGSSIGVTVAATIPEIDQALKKAASYSDTILVEEYIAGREATCSVIDRFRDERIYSTLPVEIIRPREKKVFDFDLKYSSDTQEICPGNFSKEEKQEIQRLAVAAHHELGMRHYSRSDFIVSNRGVYLLETNSLPGLTEISLLPKALMASGVQISDFIDHVLSLALSGK